MEDRLEDKSDLIKKEQEEGRMNILKTVMNMNPQNPQQQQQQQVAGGDHVNNNYRTYRSASGFHDRNSYGNKVHNNFHGGFHREKSVIWMGDVEDYMDEEFLKQAFSQCGEKVSYVRIYANRVTTDHGNVGFAFIGFKDEATAQRVLDKLKGTPIPNTVGRVFQMNLATPRVNSPGNRFNGYPSGPRRFQGHSTFQEITGNQGPSPPHAASLPSSQGNSRPSSRSVQGTFGTSNSPGNNHSSSSSVTSPVSEVPGKEYTIYVGGLDADVKPEEFDQSFKDLYKSVNYTMISIDPVTRVSKKFGFVKFSDEKEYEKALTEGARIRAKLGCDRVDVRVAQPKRQMRRNSLYSNYGSYGIPTYPDSRDRRFSTHFQQPNGSFYQTNLYYNPPVTGVNRGILHGIPAPNEGLMSDPNQIAQYQAMMSNERQLPIAMQMMKLGAQHQQQCNSVSQDASQSLAHQSQVVSTTQGNSSFSTDAQLQQPVMMQQQQAYGFNNYGYYGSYFQPEVYQNIPSGYPYYTAGMEIPQAFWTPQGYPQHADMYGQVPQIPVPVNTAVSSGVQDGDVAPNINLTQGYYQGVPLTNLNHQPYSQQSSTKPDVVPLVQQKSTEATRVTHHHMRK